MLMAGLMGMLLGMAAMVHVLTKHHCTISDASFNVVPSFCMPAADARAVKQEVVPTYTSCTKLPGVLLWATDLLAPPSHQTS